MRYEGDGPAVVNAAGEGVAVAPYGILGGHKGAAHDYAIERNGKRLPLGTKDNEVTLLPGDVIVCKSASGGGCGDPAERDPALVARDVAYGYISPAAAQEIYKRKEGP